MIGRNGLPLTCYNCDTIGCVAKWCENPAKASMYSLTEDTAAEYVRAILGEDAGKVS